MDDHFTKRLGEVEDHFTKRLGEVEDRFTKRFGEFERQLVAVEERVVEQLRDSETKLLRGFYQYQEHADVRMRKMSADISNMDTASDL